MGEFRRFIEENQHEPYVGLRAKIPLDEEVHVLNKLFRKEGFDLVVAGGAVRDYLFHTQAGGDPSNYKPKDIDLATNAPPNQVVEILTSEAARRKGIKFLPVGEAFGVIIAQVPRFLPNGKTDLQQYEIATFREDSRESDGRRPDSVTFSTRAADAKRRDLTMNALFYDIPENVNDAGEVQDYNGGQGLDDIRNKVARTVGDPSERFNEDRLRPMRVMRFFARYNEGGPKEIENSDPKLARALKEFAHLPSVSRERISQEFLSGLRSSLNPINYLKNLHYFGFMDRIFEGLKLNTRFEGLARLEGSGRMMRDPRIVLAYILKNNDGNDVAKRLTGLAYPSSKGTGEEFKLSENVKFLLDLLHFKPEAVARMSNARRRLRPDRGPNEFKEEHIQAHNQMLNAWAILNGLDMNMFHHFSQFQPTVTGHDPRLAGAKGPEIAKKIAELEAKNFQDMMGGK